jgi:hypothetical protein
MPVCEGKMQGLVLRHKKSISADVLTVPAYVWLAADPDSLLRVSPPLVTGSIFQNGMKKLKLGI